MNNSDVLFFVLPVSSKNMFTLSKITRFQELDPNHEGWVTPKDFKEKMEQQKSYTPYATTKLSINYEV